ncbi:hypothetical protein RRF57_008735 [Xylaria bambusicola]|uniref:Uncharacterized protein n=1 Tax=Xylaria bambusicola TaxID=326684 RepID=A0AAN7ZBC9_9PEZI
MSTVISSVHHVVVLATGVVVTDAASLFSLTHRRRGVNAIIVAKVVEADVASPVVDTILLQAFDDTVAASVDAVVLVFHDGTGTESTI